MAWISAALGLLLIIFNLDGPWRFPSLDRLGSILPGGVIGTPARDAASGPWRRFHAIDGDTLDGPSGRYRLHGIDAPETAQQCQAAGGSYACGEQARTELARLVAGQELSCAQLDRDAYGRSVVRCRRRDGLDIGAEMVERGWAMAYRRYGTDYVAQEERARGARRGIWRGSFTEPSTWRRANP
ncbi:thermonuclease family protein [Plastoroseomonas hellenica]|uniref:thermonuclease family protein n=1 Tax=Plastoroseomonas hellenica TaxID=2687306 RepID=UPI001BAB8254|nr:thermonuclease family protein [Plastoroseomonas hellenica]MBR0645052.1 thermonuclease family protein [Plastoroseomonas hellenica]